MLAKLRAKVSLSACWQRWGESLARNRYGDTSLLLGRLKPWISFKIMTLNRALHPPRAESDTFVSKTPIKGVVYVEIRLTKTGVGAEIARAS